MGGWFLVTSSGQGIVTRTDMCHFQTRGEVKPWSDSLQGSFPLGTITDHSSVTCEVAVAPLA